ESSTAPHARLTRGAGAARFIAGVSPITSGSTRGKTRTGPHRKNRLHTSSMLTNTAIRFALTAKILVTSHVNHPASGQVPVAFVRSPLLRRTGHLTENRQWRLHEI